MITRKKTIVNIKNRKEKRKMSNLIEKAILLEKREYAKKWRDANKEKVKQSNQKYWEKKARERLEKEGGAENE